MSAAVIQLQPRTRPAGPPASAREPLDAAFRELSAHVAADNEARRRRHARAYELGSGDPALRRKAERPRPADPSRPLTIYSIEEAEPGPSASRGRRA